MGFEVGLTSPVVLEQMGGMDDYLPDPNGTMNLEFKCILRLPKDFLSPDMAEKMDAKNLTSVY
eukprot:13553531-Heterocapsa_arctica.AAC.1